MTSCFLPMPIYFLTGAFQRGASSRGKRAFCGNFTDAARRRIDLAWAVHVIPGLVDIHSARTFRRRLRRSCQNGKVSRRERRHEPCPRVHDAALRRARSRVQTAAALKKPRPRAVRGSWASTWKGRSSREEKGAQNASYLRLPDYAAFERLKPPKVCSVSRTLPRSCPARSSLEKLKALHCVHRAHGLHLRKPAPFSTPALASDASLRITRHARHLSPPQARPHRGGIRARKTSLRSSSATDTTSTPAPRMAFRLFPRPHLPHFRRAALLRHAGRQ